MIGEQTIGRIEGAFITAVSHEGLSVMVNGKPGRLSILDSSGAVVAKGAQVVKEVEAVAINKIKSIKCIFIALCFYV
jgi:hypothetical protein